MRPGFLLAALTLAACSAPAPIGSSERAIIGGTVDEADPGVVVFLAQLAGGGGWLCTAEVVSPHVLLTAAHCVTTAPSDAATFAAFTGTVLPASGTLPADELLEVSSVATARWIGGTYDTGSSDDVAVAILATPTAIPPLPVNHFALPDDAVGKPVRLVGYGLTDGADTTGATVGTRHQATTQLQYFRPTTLTLWDLEHSNCEGDSGGPALMNVYGKERIVGVTEGGYRGCPTTLASIDTRIDPYAGFVDDYIDRYDPAPVAPGGACSSNADCGLIPCRGGVCSPYCDPSARTTTCPAGLSCIDDDGVAICGHATYHGCAFGGRAPSGGAASLLIALVVASGLWRRRRTSARGTGTASSACTAGRR